MTKVKALEILKKYTTKQNLIKHAIAVAATMKHFAKIENEDESFWEVVGMLHDIDYELYPDQHCSKCVEMLKQEGLCDNTIHAIQSHGFELCCDVEPNTYLEYVLGIIDQLTGFIIACALIRPEKQIKAVELSSMKKRWGNASFAAGTNRGRIEKWCQKINKPLDYMLEQTHLALLSVADELGL